MPGVVSVFPNLKRRLHTTHSWDFMGLLGEETMEIPGYSTKNQVNIIIGFIDTGENALLVFTPQCNFHFSIQCQSYMYISFKCQLDIDVDP